MSVPLDVRVDIVGALASLPDSEDLALDGKLGLLLSTLRAIWGLPGPLPAGGGAASGDGAATESVRKSAERAAAEAAAAAAGPSMRSSVEGLDQMKAALSAMEDQLQRL